MNRYEKLQAKIEELQAKLQERRNCDDCRWWRRMSAYDKAVTWTTRPSGGCMYPVPEWVPDDLIIGARKNYNDPGRWGGRCCCFELKPTAGDKR